MHKSQKFQRISALAKRAGLDGFILALGAVIFLAYIWPAAGAQEGLLSLKEISSYGVSAIFFFYGLRLSPEKLRMGLSNWRLHIVIHLVTFIVFPLIILTIKPLFITESAELLWLGIFFLAALPSTVSSSVVMVSIAKGNLPAAIFNASISSLLGVFITPLWMGMFMASDVAGFDLGMVVGKLIIQVLVPVLLGMLLYARLGWFAERNRQGLRYFDQSIILLIVYTSFSESFYNNMFEGLSVGDILLLSLGMVGLFFLVFALVHLVGRLLNFNRQDRVTALFCGSKKSLVHGTVMAKVLFAQTAFIGIILLPIMLYHAFQLIAASIIAQSMARNR